MAKILLTNHYIVNYAGSELVTLDIATEFQRWGWDVTVATFRFGGEIKKYFNERNIEVINVLNQSLSTIDFDLVWSHHFPVLVKCLVEDSIKTKYLLLSSLSPYEPLEAIPFFHTQANLILCNSEETKEKIIEDNKLQLFASKICVFKNSVPSNWFEIEAIKENFELKKIAIVSHHPPKEVLNAMDILRTKKIDIELIGITGNTKLVDIDLLSSYDAVITIGRTVQHCMALGIPVFCYDHFGGPGWLTPNNFQRAEWFNYSGRCCYQKLQVEQLVNELIKGFVDSRKYVKFFRNYAFDNYSLTKNIETVIASINFANAEKKDYISLNDEVVTGKIVKAYQNIFNEREVLQKELEETQFQLQNKQSEYELFKPNFQQTQSLLKFSESQLQRVQFELKQSQYQVEQINTELEHTKCQLEQTQIELEQSQQMMNAIKNSKFYKLRSMYLKLKKIL